MALEAVVLLGVFVGWLVLVSNMARRARQEAVEELGASTRWVALTIAATYMLGTVLIGA